MLVLTSIQIVSHITMITTLYSFEHDYVNPVDLCSYLNKKMDPVTIMEIAVGIIACGDFKRAWVLIILHIGSIGVIMNEKKKRTKMYDPLKVVRDITKIKVRQLIFFVIDAISLVVILVGTALTYFAV